MRCDDDDDEDMALVWISRGGGRCGTRGSDLGNSEGSNPAGSCRRGNSTIVCNMLATYIWAGMNTHTWSSIQSKYVFDVTSARS